MADKWCSQFNLCKGCKFVGNQCIVRDGETANNSKFYERMLVLIKTEMAA
ncbi:Uncharacterised protein [Hafnia alvei]|nr:Uncharacterised protein [Hafnia alvei]